MLIAARNAIWGGDTSEAGQEACYKAMRKARTLIRSLATSLFGSGRSRTKTLGEQPEYGSHKRLLIVHADDLGIARSVNAAFASGIATGFINSGSAIVASRFFSEIADLARIHPEADIGLHLALTSDSATDPWAPTAPRALVPSLIDKDGYFLNNWPHKKNVNPHEVEIETRAQVEKAYAAGLRPTHLDSHRFRLLLSGKEIFEVYLRLGRAYQLPVLIPRQWFPRVPYLESCLTQDDVTVDRMVIINGRIAPDQWSSFYRSALESLPAGVTEFLIHPGFDDDELQRFFEYRAEWGAAWRQRDFDFFTSDEFRDLLTKHEITLITWRDIASRRRSVFGLANGEDVIGSSRRRLFA